MIDILPATELVQQQIKSSVDQQIQVLMANEDWINQIEQTIIESIKTRIIAKFSNISTVPDLVDTVKSTVSTLFEQGSVPDLKNYINQDLITQAVDRGVEELVASSINALVVDQEWIEKIENQVNQTMSDRLSKLLKSIDINSLLVTHIDQGINRWQDRLKKDFRTNGIVDQAQDTELTVMDGVVVVERDFVAKNVQVTQDLSIKNLIVSGTINTDNCSWRELKDLVSQQVLTATTEQWHQDLVQQVLERAKLEGINFESVLIDNQRLIENNTLSAVVVDSHLQSTGTLKSLKVAGSAQFGQTMHVSGRRVGINTQEPEMALSVWDEEVSVIAGKLSKQQAFVGTARLQNLAIGVNRVPQIEIDTDGLTTIKQLRVGRHRISHSGTVPGYSGTRGDLVLNSDPKPGTPFAWVCLGAFQWQSLHSAR
jgi:hypothetical protein